MTDVDRVTLTGKITLAYNLAYDNQYIRGSGIINNLTNILSTMPNGSLDRAENFYYIYSFDKLKFERTTNTGKNSYNNVEYIYSIKSISFTMGGGVSVCNNYNIDGWKTSDTSRTPDWSVPETDNTATTVKHNINVEGITTFKVKCNKQNYGGGPGGPTFEFEKKKNTSSITYKN